MRSVSGSATSRLCSRLRSHKLEDYLANCDQLTLDLVASFQRAIVEDLVGKTLAAARAYDVATLFVTGGVAANQELRQTFEREGAQARPARLLPLASAVDRQRRHDRRRRLSKISAEKFCCDGFFRRGRNAFEVRSFLTEESERATRRSTKFTSPPRLPGSPCPAPHPAPYPAVLRCRYL